MNAIKIGFSSFALRWHIAEGMSPFMLLEKAKNLGAEVVQLCENVRIDELPSGDLLSLRRLAEEVGLSLELGVSGGDVETLKRGVRNAEILGAQILRAVIDSDGETPETVGKNIRAVLPTLRQTRITLCIENHFRFPPAIIAALIREAEDEYVAGCLDPLNSIALLFCPRETLKRLADLARTAHIKDACIIRTGTSFLISGCPIGQGMVDVDGYIRMIRGNITSLLIESWMDKKESLEETLREELSWLKVGLDYIRRKI